MSTVDSVGAHAAGSYYVRSRQEVRAQPVQAQPQPLGRVRQADTVSFAERVQQIASGVAHALTKPAETAAAAKPATLAADEGKAGIGESPEAAQENEAQAQQAFGQDDLTGLIASFGATGKDANFNAMYDLNSDGFIDTFDLNQMLANFVAEPEQG